MQISQLLQKGKNELEKCGVAEAEVDAVLLLGHCLGKSRTQLYLGAKDLVEAKVCNKFFTLIHRRARREPVAYILGEKEFWSLPFSIDNSVLIPRPETEYLLECVLRTVKENKLVVNNVLDLCCGSGVIGIVLALELQTKICAVDYSEMALITAMKNYRLHGAEAQVVAIHSDLFTEIGNKAYDLIVTNPPYVKSNEIATVVEPEVACFEPRIALDGGGDGLDIIRRISMDILGYLQPGGLFLMEIGADQGTEVKTLFSRIEKNGRYFEEVEIFKDYSRRDRVLHAKANNYSE